MNEPAMTNVWAIHSDKGGMPLLRGWAKSEAEATKKMGEIQANDFNKDDRYWVTRLDEMALSALKGSGLIPAEA